MRSNLHLYAAAGGGNRILRRADVESARRGLL
jgi:hypothetical protein